MPTVVNVDVNKLLCDIRKLTAANKRLETVAALGIACAVAIYMDSKRQIKELKNEIAELKKVEGE
jgi:hypothetical protein